MKPIGSRCPAACVFGTPTKRGLQCCLAVSQQRTWRVQSEERRARSSIDVADNRRDPEVEWCKYVVAEAVDREYVYSIHIHFYIPSLGRYPEQILAWCSIWKVLHACQILPRGLGTICPYLLLRTKHVYNRAFVIEDACGGSLPPSQSLWQVAAHAKHEHKHMHHTPVNDRNEVCSGVSCFQYASAFILRCIWMRADIYLSIIYRHTSGLSQAVRPHVQNDLQLGVLCAVQFSLPWTRTGMYIP